MRDAPALLLIPALLASLLACGEGPSIGEPLSMGLTEVRPVTGRWYGTAGSSDIVDLDLTEIQNDVGGAGTVIRGGDTTAVGVEGRHEGRRVTLRVTGQGAGWDFRANLLGDDVSAMRGDWTYLGTPTGLTLFRCEGDDLCP